MSKFIFWASGVILSCVCVVCLLLNIYLLPGYSAQSIIVQNENIGLVVDAPQPLFKVENFAPGDSAEGVLTVHNKGVKPFDYKAEVVNKNGNSSFLDLLHLRIQDQNGTERYVGKLSSCDMSKVTLSPGTNEQLTWVVYFPADAGNEFQAAKASFDIVFNAQGSGENGGGGGGGINGGGDSGGGGDNTGSDSGSGTGGDNEPIPQDDNQQPEINTTPDTPDNENNNKPPAIKPGQPESAPGGELSNPTPHHNKVKLPYTGGTYWVFILGGMVLISAGLLWGSRNRGR